MLLVFLKCLVIGHSYEELDCYILVTVLGSSAVVKVTMHLTDFLSECDIDVQVNGWGCAYQRMGPHL